MEKNEIIVAFHIGRGGRFNNAGHLEFWGQKEIGAFTDNLFDRYEYQSNFKKRYGYNYCDRDQRCIVDLITDQDFDELEEKFGITEKMLGEIYYYKQNGNPTGLSQSDVEIGIGRIDIDGEYDTTYTVYLKDCNEQEINAIRRSDCWDKDDLLSYFEEI